MKEKYITIDYNEYLDLIKLTNIIRHLYFKGLTPELKSEIEELNEKYGWWV